MRISACQIHLSYYSNPIGFYAKTILKVYYPRTIHAMFAILAYWFQRRRFLNIFPIGSYVKTMSADGGHLVWRSGSPDTILKIDHLRTIHVMLALNWLTGLRGEDF